MRKQKLLYALFLFATLLLAANYSTAELDTHSDSHPEAAPNSNSEENFDKMMAVLTHPRCMNCHPSDNIPKQGEDSHPHYFGMAREAGNLGF